MPLFSKEIYVSRHHGNKFAYCGETIHTACKMIGLAIAQAQWNDTIYIDGTDTSRDPYPCLPTTSHTGGLYVNKSLSLKKFGDAEVFLNCSSSRQIVFDGSNAVSETVIIQLTGLTLFNSSVTARNCSLYVSRCLFTNAMPFPNATAVVNFEALHEHLSLTIQKSVFSNNAFSCICVVGISPRIEVHSSTFISNNATWESLKMGDVAVFMVLLSSEHKEHALSMMTLTNILFMYNVAPFGGCLHIQTISVNSGNRQTVKSRQKDRGTIQKDVSIISQPNSTGYVKRQSTSGSILVHISETTFHHNAGGRAITVNRDVNMINITITKSDFINNSSPLQGGAMLVESIDAFFLHIEDCKFLENSARNEGSAIYVIALTLKTGSAVFRNVLFMRNVLHNPDFIEDFPKGGTLALYVPKSYLKVYFENVSFINNKVAMGSSTLYAHGYFLELTIVKCTFHANSQDKRFTYDWKTISIDSYQLHFTLIDTIISENEANTPTFDNETLEGQPVHFRVEAFDLARINMSGVHYKNNKGGGIYVQLGLNEMKQLCSCRTLTLKTMNYFPWRLRRKHITRVFFTGNSFAVTDSGLGSFALFFLHTTAQGNQIAMEDTIFENNAIQGAILLFRLPPDERDFRACTIPKWNYGNLIRFIKVTFHKNNPSTSVMRLENGHNTLRNCQFVDNFAAYAIFIAESSTSLELLETSFKHTRYCREMDTIRLPFLKLMISAGFRGFIYYASSGPINLKNATLTVDTAQDIDAYIMVTGSSTAHVDNSSVIQCPVGTLRGWAKFSHTHFVSNDACPNGLYNAMSQSFIISCKTCSTGFYSVKPFAEKCLPCPFGGNCSSGIIAAKPTFWGFPLLPDHEFINFQNCPIGYCCPTKNISCPYDNKHYLSNGCSGNRTGFLCGNCKPGFTETLFSPQCRANDFCTDYWFWPVAMLYSLAFALFLLWKNPITRLIKRLLPWGQPAPDGHLGSDPSSKGSGYIKVLFYSVYQVANLVFVSEDIEIHLAYSYLLTPIIGWFDFKAISSNDGLVCPFGGLTVPSKIFLHASQVFAVLLGVLVIFLLHGAFRKFGKQSPAVPSSGQYFGATTECLLLGYSALACAALKTLNCVEIQSTYRFFYDANIQCWRWWQKMSGVFLAVYIIPFVFVLYLGSSLLNGKVISTKKFLCACVFPLPFAVLWMVTCKKGTRNITESQRVNDELSPLLTRNPSAEAEHDHHDLTDDVVYGPFRKSNAAQGPGTVYWESVLIGRRLVLICLHTFIVFPFVRMVCLSVTCAAILVHHIWKKPFQDPRVNHAETASLTALLVLAVINMAEATLGMNGELLSEQERVCMTVLHVAEVIILGTVPVIFLVVILISVAWQLIKFCQFCLAAPYRLLVYQSHY